MSEQQMQPAWTLVHSPDLDKIAPAMVKVAAEIQNPKKGSANEHFKSKYADLAAVLDQIRPVAAKHGIVVIQSPAPIDENVLEVETLVLHESGQWIRGVCSSALTDRGQASQIVGSAITYLRRYSIQALFSVAPEGEDDDGNAASDPGGEPVQGRGGRSRQSRGSRTSGSGGGGSRDEVDTTGWPAPGHKGFPMSVVEKIRAKIPEPAKQKALSDAQLKMLWSVAKGNGWSEENFRDIVGTVSDGQWSSPREITWHVVSELRKALMMYVPAAGGTAFDAEPPEGM